MRQYGDLPPAVAVAADAGCWSPTSRSIRRCSRVIVAPARGARSACAGCCWRRPSGWRPSSAAATCSPAFPGCCSATARRRVLPVAQIASLVGVYGLSALVALVSDVAGAARRSTATPCGGGWRGVAVAGAWSATVGVGQRRGCATDALTREGDAAPRRPRPGQRPAGREVGPAQRASAILADLPRADAAGRRGAARGSSSGRSRPRRSSSRTIRSAATRSGGSRSRPRTLHPVRQRPDRAQARRRATTTRRSWWTPTARWRRSTGRCTWCRSASTCR